MDGCEEPGEAGQVGRSVSGSRDETAEPWRLLWAKTAKDADGHASYHPLLCHMLDVAAVSLALPNPLTAFGWLDIHTAFVAALHDIGKADSVFQHQVAELSKVLRQAGYRVTGDARCRHERLSARFLEGKLAATGLAPRSVAAVTSAVGWHHGRWEGLGRDVASEYAQARDMLRDTLARLLGVEDTPTEIPSDLSAFGMRLAGHIVLCDWIASNERFFTDARLGSVDDLECYWESSKTIATEWIAELGLTRVDSSGRPDRIVESPRPIQRVLIEEDIPPSLVIVEAPMGEGKTEAAWILGERWRDHGCCGMYMALPTMATSDSLHGRYRDDYLGKMARGEGANLVHGMAWLRDAKEPESQASASEPGDDSSFAEAWFRPTRRAMLTAHGVGTVDQAMLAGMNVKFGFLRLYGLSDRVLVIDEVHAYDAYMSAIITRLLEWCACLKIPVILLSATLSASQRAAMLEAYGATGVAAEPDEPYPLISVAETGKEPRTIEVDASSTRDLRIETHLGLLGDAEKTARMAEDLVGHDGCCCVVSNTVKQAQAVYAALSLPEDEKLLFHARFTAADRKDICDRVLAKFGKDTSSRPSRFVLVATQVVEQSLDVDFDHMITDIAPIDLLLQRSGRMHRHGRRESEPTLHVLVPEDGSLKFGGTGYVYGDKPLLRTLAILAGQRLVHLPDDFRLLIDRCYGTGEWEQDAVDWAAVGKADEVWDGEARRLEYEARQFALCKPTTRAFRPVGNDPTGDDSDDGNGWRASTRLGATDRTAILVDIGQLPRLERGELRMEEVRDLYRSSVKLPRYLPIGSPAAGYDAAAEAQGKLRGVVLLPLSDDGLWRGVDEKGRCHEVRYDERLGLLIGRVE